MNQTWKLRVQEPVLAVVELSEALKIPQFAGQILLQKGIDSRTKAVSFFKPQDHPLHDPFLMCNMSKAVLRLSQAITNQEKVLLFGDYDVDGDRKSVV